MKNGSFFKPQLRLTAQLPTPKLRKEFNKMKRNQMKKPMPDGAKKVLRVWCSIVLVALLLSALAVTCFAADDDPITVVNNLSDFMFGLVRAVGMIMLGFAVVQIGLSLKSHDPSQRAQGFLTLAGGVVITFAKEILTLITGG